MDTAPITVSTDVCDDGCVLTINWPIQILGIIVLILICIMWGVYYIYRQKQRRRKTNQIDKRFLPCQNTMINSSDATKIYFPLIFFIVPIKQIEIRRNVCLFSTPETYTACITSLDIYSIPSVRINEPIKQVFPLFAERKLICYCDGSYSHDMQIGHSGFLTSNGTRRIRFFSPRNPRCGSTDAEVLGACLAIQYALEKHYNILIIHTDNSKVEQLLKRPKQKDNIDYPNICQMLNEYKKQQGNNTIQVVRVRGHTSKYEQEKCQIKYDFAQIDQTVRRKTRQYKKRWSKRSEQTYYYFYWYKPAHYLYYT